MSYGLFLPRRWTRQPQGPVEVDWGNPITRALCFAAIPGRSAVFPNLQQTVAGNFSIKPGDSGIAAAAPATQLPGYVSWPFATSHSGDFAIAALCSPSTDTNVSVPTHVATATNNHQLIVSAGGFSALADNNFAGSSVANSDFVGKTTLYGVDRTGNTARKWRSGRNEGQGVTGTRLFEPTGFLIGRGTTGNNLQNAKTYLYLGWLRALSAPEWQEAAGAPWLLFKPRRPVLYSFPSGGITIPTLSLPGVQDITATGARPKVTLTF